MRTAFDFHRPGTATAWLFGHCGSRISKLIIALALLLAVFAAAALVMQGARTQSSLDELDADAAARRDTRVPSKSSIQQPALSAAQLRQINQTVDRLNFSWAALLDDLERLTPANVALLQIDPQVDARTVHLLIAAKSASDVLDYVQALRGASTIDEPRLIKHEPEIQDVLQTGRFTVVARLRSFASARPVDAAATSTPTPSGFIRS